MVLLEKTKKLNIENKKLQQKLREAREAIDSIKSGNIDALVVANKKDLKVFTETSADKAYRILIEKMHEGAVTLDDNETILFCNSRFANMVKLPLQKVTGTKFKKFIAGSSKDRFEVLLKKGWKKAAKDEVYLHTNDGKAIPVLMSVKAVFLDTDYVLSIILTDLTIQNKNQEKLKSRTWQLEQKNIEFEKANKELAFQYSEKEKRAAELSIANKELASQNEEKEKRVAELSILFKFATEGIFVVTEKGVITELNPSAEKMFGYEKDQLLGKKIEKLIPKRFSKIHQAHRKKYSKYPHSLAMGAGLELLGVKKDGTEFPLECSLSPFSTSKGNFVIVFIVDISIRKQADAIINEKSKALEQSYKAIEKKNVSLEKLNKELETFTFVSSHDLQEPLRKINNFVSVLLQEEEKKLSEEGKNYLRRMYKTSKGMQELIEDLLTYARTKGSEQKFEKTDLTIIVDEVKKNFEEAIFEKKARIEASNLGQASIIRFQFRQLFQNLISNSLKFSKPRISPHIKIKSKIVKGSKLNNEKLSSKIDYCHIIYTDNGIGFDPQYNDLIFEVFQRLHSKEKYKGTGMGLAICKRIIENHKGLITATGKLNKGARFDIYIPVL